MFTALALTCLVSPAQPAAATPADSTVYVRSATRRGTGTAVGRSGDRTLLLTCKHVVPARTAVTITHKGVDHPAEWLAASPSDDLALIATAAAVPIAPLGVTPAAGTPLRHWGWRSHYRTGTATGRRVAVTENLVAATLPAAPGDSGAGAFDAAGSLVGVVARSDGSASWLVPADAVASFLGRPAPLSPADAAYARAVALARARVKAATVTTKVDEPPAALDDPPAAK